MLNNSTPVFSKILFLFCLILLLSLSRIINVQSFTKTIFGPQNALVNTTLFTQSALTKTATAFLEAVLPYEISDNPAPVLKGTIVRVFTDLNKETKTDAVAASNCITTPILN